MNYIICISSDSEEEISKKSTINIDANVKQKKKINSTQKRKLSPSPKLQKENTTKKSKISKNRTKVIDIKNSNEFCSNRVSKDFLNDTQFTAANGLRTNSVSNNLSSSCSSPQAKTPAEHNLSKSKLLMETEIVKELNKSLSQPSTSQESCQIKKCIKPKLVIKEKIAIPEPEIDVFTRFINICLEKRNDDITIKILDKLKKRYEKLEPIFLNNEELKSFIEDIIQNILKTDEKKFYFYIEEVSNEIKRLNCESKIVQIDEKYANTENNKLDKVEINENIVLEQENYTLSENYIPSENHTLSENDLHKLNKLNKAIRKCQQRIKILETQEVDFDEEEDSTYIQEDRYKRKLIELYALRSKLIGDKSVKKQIYKQLLRLKDIPGKITGIRVLDEAILTFINSSIKKVNRLRHIKNPTAIADFLTVPDYHDIIQCISYCNNQEDLELTDRKIKMLALTAHQSLVHYLKKQRICESQNYLSFYGECKGDPAITNDELHTKLQQNKEKGDRKLENIFKQYEKKEELTANEEDQQTLENACSEDEDKRNEQYKNDKEIDKTKKINILDENEKSESNVNLMEKNVEKIFKSSEEIEENLESSNFEDKSQQNDRKTNDKQTDKTKQIITFAQIEISPRKLVEKNLENSFKNSEEIEQLSPVDRIHETLKNIDFDRMHQQNEKCTNDDEKEETKETNLPAENEKLAEKEDRVVGRLEKILKNSEDNERLLLADENQQTLENPNLNKACEEEEEEEEEEIYINNKQVDRTKQVNSSNVNEEFGEKLSSEEENKLHVENKQKDSTKLQNANNKINHKRKNQKNIHNANSNVICEKTELFTSETSKEPVIQSIVSNSTCAMNNISKNNTNSSLVEPDKIIEILSDEDEKILNNKKNYNADVIKKTNITNNNLENESTNTDLSTPDIQEISQILKTKNISTLDNQIVQYNDSAEITETIKKNQQTSSREAAESKAPEENVDVNKKKKWIGQESRYAIKVRSFAKPPDSWKDSSSPEKVEQNLSLPKQQRIADLPTPGFIDLTSEQNYRLPSTSAIVSNPLAINNRRMPVNNAVLLKNIISNYKIPFHQSNVKGPKIATLKNVCVVNPKIGQAMTYVPKTNILLSNVNSDNNLNHVPNTLPSNTVISPCLTVRLQENNT